MGNHSINNLIEKIHCYLLKPAPVVLLDAFVNTYDSKKPVMPVMVEGAVRIFDLDVTPTERDSLPGNLMYVVLPNGSTPQNTPTSSTFFGLLFEEGKY